MKPENIKKIAIAGVGGIGSHLIQMLYNFGAERDQFPFTEYEVDIFDDDIVEPKNLLHQNFKEDELGQPKVEILANRYAVTPVSRFMTVEDFPKYDLIFCCVDSMVFRSELYKWSWENPKKLFWIDGRCESTQGAVFNSTISQAQLEKFLNDNTERRGCLLKDEKENNISHTLPIIVAATMLQVFLNFLRGGHYIIPKEKIFMV